MKSPFTGNEMKLMHERRELDFRKESYSVVYHFYECVDTGEKFTSTALDEINQLQLHNQYRSMHNLPFPEEVKEIREQYGLSATKMSEVLGFGVNSYRNYESGEVPSSSNGKLIQLAKDPSKFRDLIHISESIDEETRTELIKKINSKIHKQEDELFNFNSSSLFERYLLDGELPDELCGYKKPNLSKFTEMIVFFSDRISNLYKTKLNKLLFYADFLNYKETCYAISGARYRAIDMGPVPNNFNSIFEYLAKKDEFDITYVNFHNDYMGEKFTAREDRPFNPSLFKEDELIILERVAERFKTTTTSEIIEISHTEKAWQDNQKNKDLINYNYGFELAQI